MIEPTSEKRTVTRVLIGEFGAIATLGLRQMLEEGCEIVAEGTGWGDIVRRVREVSPDVVVVDADSTPGFSDARSLIGQMPGLTVIGCSLLEPTLHVISGRGESYTTELSPSSLLDAVNER